MRNITARRAISRKVVHFGMFLFLTPFLIVFSYGAGAAGIPITLQKAGAKSFADIGIAGGHDLRPEGLPLQDLATGTGSVAVITDEEQESGDSNENDTGNEYNDYESQSNEDQCPDGKMFYLKSQQCVPTRCASGTRRDIASGICDPLWSNFIPSSSPGFFYRGSGMYNRNRYAPKFRFPRFRG